MSHRPTVAAIALVSALLQAPAAMGQVEEGVTVDPASPAGKEYALPIDRARREAAGSAETPVLPGSPATPAFGQGVGADTASGPGSSDAGAGAGVAADLGSQGAADQEKSQADEQSAPTTAERARVRDDVDRALTKASVGAEGGGNLTFVLGGIALAILGGAIGLLARHRPW